MSKYVNVPKGNYKITVQDGNRITLDTGLNVGEVYITGDLVVQGETTTINTTDLNIEDRVIHLNTGDEGGAGIQGPDGFSGLEIERGTFPDVFFGFDEDLAWLNPGGRQGSFVFKDQNEGLIGIRTNSIANQNLVLQKLLVISQSFPHYKHYFYEVCLNEHLQFLYYLFRKVQYFYPSSSSPNLICAALINSSLIEKDLNLIFVEKLFDNFLPILFKKLFLIKFVRSSFFRKSNSP